MKSVKGCWSNGDFGSQRKRTNGTIVSSRTQWRKNNTLHEDRHSHPQLISRYASQLTQEDQQQPARLEFVDLTVVTRWKLPTRCWLQFIIRTKSKNGIRNGSIPNGSQTMYRKLLPTQPERKPQISFLSKEDVQNMNKSALSLRKLWWRSISAVKSVESKMEEAKEKRIVFKFRKL